MNTVLTYAYYSLGRSKPIGRTSKMWLVTKRQQEEELIKGRINPETTTIRQGEKDMLHVRIGKKKEFEVLVLAPLNNRDGGHRVICPCCGMGMPGINGRVEVSKYTHASPAGDIHNLLLVPESPPPKLNLKRIYKTEWVFAEAFTRAGQRP